MIYESFFEDSDEELNDIAFTSSDDGSIESENEE
jgi:hypothetical protein